MIRVGAPGVTYAIVFLGTTSGVKALRVDPATGKLTPLQGSL